MPTNPLLIFPRFYQDSRKPKKTGFGSPHYHKPDPNKQNDRLSPIFSNMLQAYISTSPEGISPENTLVFEIVGDVEDFQRAVNAIEGLEWQGEYDTEFKADDDFYLNYIKIGSRFFVDKDKDVQAKLSSEIFEKLKSKGLIEKVGSEYFIDIDNIRNVEIYLGSEYTDISSLLSTHLSQKVNKVTKKPLKGRYFLSVSNKKSIQMIQSMWNKVKQGEDLGISNKKWKDILLNTINIRSWDINDRIRETNILKYFKDEIKLKKNTKSEILFEIELWHRTDELKRKKIEEYVSKLLQNEKGKILSVCLIEEIRFHAIKASLPYDRVVKIISSDFPGIFRCNDIMFLRPSGQCASPILEGNTSPIQQGKQSTEILEDNPVAACLDGHPLPNHALLSNMLSIDDPDDFFSGYKPKEMKHGTAMASLICYGDLESNDDPIKRKLYIRPIMKPDPDDFVNDSRGEIVPKELFFEDLVERTVIRIFEGEQDEPPVAPNVKVINLAVCDKNKIFYGQMSSLARLIDWLSFKYNVLFVISAGNFSNPFQLNIELQNSNISESDLINKVFSKIISDLRNRKLLSPSESINAITVGALHGDEVDEYTHSNNVFNIQSNEMLPSPYSSFGFGLRNSIKPDILIAGGRQLYRKNEKNEFTPIESTLPPGQKTAQPGPEGEINRQIFSRGTSNSCALCTKMAIKIYEILMELNSEFSYNIPYENFPVLLKTLLIHCSSWSGAVDQLSEILIHNNTPKRKLKNEISRYLGYGTPQISRVLECTQSRVTAIGASIIKQDQRHEYRLPLPPSFSGRTDERKLAITLAWFSPVNCFSKKYRIASLFFEPPTNTIGVARSEASWQQVKNGTVQHEILKGNQAIQYIDGDYLSIPVVCKKDASALDDEIKYGLAVTLEIPDEIDIPIYEEIKERIEIGIEIEIEND